MLITFKVKCESLATVVHVEGLDTTMLEVYIDKRVNFKECSYALNLTFLRLMNSINFASLNFRGKT